MSQLLPSAPAVDTSDREGRVVRLEDADEGDDETFEILSSSTARSILVSLYDEPAPASVVAERVDSSIQNVRYHLDRLQANDLVEVADTWYSSKGVEMDVYAPTSEPLVITAGDDDERVTAPTHQLG
jgi:hypothetical protein